MSDIPQNDIAPTENQPEGEIEINDSVPASETGEQAQAESEVQVDEVALAKQKANEAFNKQYGQLKQTERERDAAQERLEALEKAERERQAALVGEIPPMPDQFDDDYEQKVKARDDAIAAKASFNAQNQAYLRQQEQIQQQQAQAKEQEIIKSMQNYSTKANELGIKQEELQAAGNTVAGYGLSDDLVIHIINDPDGPLITKHLAANPMDGHQLANMSPYAVGSFLDNIKQKASALKPKTSNTPEPATNLKGQGVDKDAGYFSSISDAKLL